MSEDLKNNISYIENKEAKLVGPILFFVFVLIVSFSLFAYNKYVNKQTATLNSEIASLKQTIDALNDKKEIQVYSLLESNKAMIEELDKRSKISTYIKHLKSLYPENVYGISFEGFSLTNGKINTKATIESTNKIAYEKTRDFIRNYRTSTGALLDLEFINLVEGMDSIKFDANFKIK